MIEGVFKYTPGFTFRFAEYCIALVLFTFPGINSLHSQDYYSTRKGQVIVQSIYYDTVLTVKSSELIMNLDYGKANLKMSVNLSSFNSGLDSINAKLNALTNKNISFTGKLGLDYINTKPHLQQHFSFDGTVTYNGINEEVNGKGTLTHVTSNGVITSCVLWLEFKLDTAKFFWELPRYGFSDVITINIIQAILDKS